jgi:outer membrane protein assembly factor BamB
MVFIGISGPEDGPDGRRHPGGFALLDPDTGAIIKRTYVVSLEDDARGYKGGSMWGTAVWDAATNLMYDGTGQPANKDRETSLSNALLKIDVDRASDSFGQILAHYHGDFDDRADVDFGGSPMLFTDSDGNKLIGALQKSGKFHAVFADTMEQAWWAKLGDPLALGHAGSGAFDGNSIYIAGNTQTDADSSAAPNPGYLYSLDRDTGAVNWKTPVASGGDYHLITAAGGVVYMVTTTGLLLGLDASNGLPVLVRSLTVDALDPCVNASSGVSVARHTVFAVCDIGAAGGGWIVAYGAL